MDELILVLKDDFGYNEFLEIANDNKWIKIELKQEGGEDKEFEEKWQTTNKKNDICYIDNPFTITHHINLAGPEINSIAMIISQKIPFYSIDELIETAKKSHDRNEIVLSLFRLTVAAKNFTASICRLFDAAVTHEDSFIRKAAIQAMGYRYRPETWPLLHTAAQEDSDVGNKKYAKKIIDYYTQKKTTSMS